MATKFEVYKCELCGNVVQVTTTGGGNLVCCGKQMTMQKENTVEASKEKHIPVVEKNEKGIFVKVGSVAHPMEDKHYIEWIQVIHGSRTNIKFFKPGEAPEAQFCISADEYNVRAYCNIHGLWKS